MEKTASSCTRRCETQGLVLRDSRSGARGRMSPDMCQALTEGRGARSLAHCRAQSGSVLEQETEGAWDRSWSSLPPPAARAAATASQPRNTGVCLSQGWLRGTGTRDRGVTPGAEATRPMDGSAAAGGALGVLPPKLRAPAQPPGEGMCPAPQTLTLMFELKNIKKY